MFITETSPLLSVMALPLLLVCLSACATRVVRGGRDDDNSKNLTSPVESLADRIVNLRDELGSLLQMNALSGNEFMSFESRLYKCNVLRSLYRSAGQKYPELPNQLFSTRIRDMLNNCSDRNFRMLDFFTQENPTFPGTKWCGPGNKAENWHDLGIFNETDSCCRDHDNCEDIIRPGRTKHNLVNPYGTTRLHCKCDEDLRRCFQNVNSVVSNAVGYIFFSLLQTQCYDFNHPASGCLMWRRGAVRLYCVKYKMEEDQPKKWQWFDQEPYL